MTWEKKTNSGHKVVFFVFFVVLFLQEIVQMHMLAGFVFAVFINAFKFHETMSSTNPLTQFAKADRRRCI